MGQQRWPRTSVGKLLLLLLVAGARAVSAAQPGASYSQADARRWLQQVSGVDPQECALKTANAWLTERTDVPVDTWPLVQQFAMQQALSLAGCLAVDPPPISAYLVASAHMPESYAGIAAYTAMKHGANVSVVLTPGNATTQELLDFVAATQTTVTVWSEDYYYNTGFDATSRDLDCLENQNINKLAPDNVLSPRTYLMLYYRVDWFATLGLQPPDTWDQLLALATNSSLWQMVSNDKSGGEESWPGGNGGEDSFDFVQGVEESSVRGEESSVQGEESSVQGEESSVQGEESSDEGEESRAPDEGSGVQGLCLDMAPMCAGSYLLLAIWGSISQHLGPSQGLHFDPATLDPLVDSPAMREAARIFLDLTNASGKESAASCGPVSASFLEGNCAMTITWDQFFRFTADSKVSGNIGFSGLPGSALIWDRSRGLESVALVPCGGTGSTRPAPAPRNSTVVNCPHGRQLPDGRVINEAPASSMNYMVTDVSAEDENKEPEGLAVISMIKRPSRRYLRSRQAVTDAMLMAVQPQSRETSDPAPAPERPLVIFPSPGTPAPLADLTAFLETFPGLDGEDAQRYFKTFWALKWHPNTAGDISIANAEFARSAFFLATQRLLTEGLGPLDNILTTLADRYTNTLDSVSNPGEIYRRTIGWLPPPPSPPPPPPPSPSPMPPKPPYPARPGADASPAGLQGPIIMAFVLPFVAVALVCLWLYSRYMAAHHRTIFGAISAPVVSSKTSLVVTDIEDSTSMWESLEQEVMDLAVRGHHAAVRACIQRHRAYEVATEGDSFIIATHSALDALNLSLDIQAAMLQVAWPAELLNMPVCRGVWVVPGKGRRAAAPEVVFTRASKPDWSAANNTSGYSGQPQGGSRWCNFLACGGDWRKGSEQSKATHNPLFGSMHSHIALGSQPQISMMREPDSQAGAIMMHPASPLTDFNRQSEIGDRPTDEIRSGPSEPSSHAAKHAGNRALSYNGMVAQRSTTPTTLTDNETETMARDTTSTGHSPPENLVMAAGSHRSNTVRQHLQASAQLRDAPPSGTGSHYQLMSGLRLRIGIATGLHDASNRILNESGRAEYSGPSLELARSLAHACPGGIVLLSSSTRGHLPLGSLPKEVVVAQYGEYELAGDPVPVTLRLFTAFRNEQVYRFLRMTPVRCQKQLSASFLDAPYGYAAIAFLHVVGITTLSAWDVACASESLQLLNTVLTSQLAAFGGYLVELPAGLCLAAFPHPHAAARWALTCVQVALTLDWPEALLGHELGEELSVPFASANDGITMRRSLDRQTPGPVRHQAALGKGKASGMTRLSQSFTLLAPPHKSVRRTKTQTGIAVTKAARSVAEQPSDSSDGDEDDPQVGMGAHQDVIMRGLRIKVGIDYGRVNASVHATLGAMTYRGRVMNRASRVSSAAKSGQVWVTEAAWTHGLPAAPLDAPEASPGPAQGSTRSSMGVPLSPWSKLMRLRGAQQQGPLSPSGLSTSGPLDKGNGFGKREDYSVGAVYESDASRASAQAAELPRHEAEDLPNGSGRISTPGTFLEVGVSPRKPPQLAVSLDKPGRADAEQKMNNNSAPGEIGERGSNYIGERDSPCSPSRSASGSSANDTHPAMEPQLGFFRACDTMTTATQLAYRQARMVATPLGPIKLKGVMEEVNVVRCSFAAHPLRH